MRLRALIPLVLLAAAQSALAAGFSVTPVRIYMKPQDRAVAVTISNEADAPVVLQADLYTWSQKADGTDDLVLTEARQVVRLARLVPPDPARQATYRLIMREIPEALAPKDRIQVGIALALSMPVFITPPAARREMSCSAAGVEAATLQVACENKGSAYAQVREILVKQGNAVLGRFEGGAYILPGARKAMPVKLEGGLPQGALQLVVTYDDGRSEAFEASR
jgi:fimbrial chaperone protein